MQRNIENLNQAKRNYLEQHPTHDVELWDYKVVIFIPDIEVGKMFIDFKTFCLQNNARWQ